MMRSDPLNWYYFGGYTEMTAPSLRVYSTGKDESKRSNVNKTLSQNFSADVDKLCSTEIEKSFVPNFNVSIVFEGRKNIPDVSYEILYMATEGNA